MKQSYKGYYINSSKEKKKFYGNQTHFKILLELLGMKTGNEEDMDLYIYEFLENYDNSFLLFHIDTDSILGCMVFFKEDSFDIAMENIEELKLYDKCEIYKMISQDRKEQVLLEELKNNKGKGR